MKPARKTRRYHPVPLSEGTVRLLKEIQKRILLEPKQFFMEWWQGVHTRCSRNLPLEVPNCGTAACIGGHGMAILQNANPRDAVIDPHNLPNQFGISRSQADRLFYKERWPVQFQIEYNNTFQQTSARARVAFRRIKFFIETNGTDKPRKRGGK